MIKRQPLAIKNIYQHSKPALFNEYKQYSLHKNIKKNDFGVDKHANNLKMYDWKHNNFGKKNTKGSQNHHQDIFLQKENMNFNENTPKYAHEDIILESQQIDKLSNIRCISKECSSINQKMSNEYANSRNLQDPLHQFSALFQKTQPSDKQDFQIQICSISDSQSWFNLCEENHEQDILFGSGFNKKFYYEKINSKGNEKIYETTNKVKKNHQKGQIRKNINRVQNKPVFQQNFFKQKQKSKSKENDQISLDEQINNIFKALDGDSTKILHKNNCKNDRLSTEINYLIGSLINKIKFGHKEYKTKEFVEEFKKLIEDSDREELNQLLRDNRIKIKSFLAQSKQENVQNNRFQKQNAYNKEIYLEKMDSKSLKYEYLSQSQPIVPNINTKLSKINIKLNNYLTKNDLLSKRSSISHLQEQNQFLQVPTFRKNLSQFSKTTNLLSFHRSNILQDSKQYQEDSTDLKILKISLSRPLEIIKGSQGGQFQLKFQELNRHLH